METCYMCEAPKTSVEHVPPKCLFPEQKDLPDNCDYRKNLITVPSWETHNTTKSKNDEFFLMYMGANLYANFPSRIHQQTKLLRILKRKPHVWAEMLKHARPIKALNKEGKVQDTCVFRIDETRFCNQMKHIAKGIYFDHYKKKWLPEVQIAPIEELFATNIKTSSAKLKKTSSELFLERQKYGENIEVFFYQIVEGSSDILILANFYEHLKVLLIYTKKDQKNLEDFKI